ncbi:hypothetical protein MHYP_G00073650 [Metynnis hypsauchen]
MMLLIHHLRVEAAAACSVKQTSTGSFDWTDKGSTCCHSTPTSLVCGLDLKGDPVVRRVTVRIPNAVDEESQQGLWHYSQRLSTFSYTGILGTCCTSIAAGGKKRAAEESGRKKWTLRADTNPARFLDQTQ